MSKTDYYQVLEVSKGADAEQVKQAFRSKARKLHPDVSDDPDAGKKFSELNEAYEVLSDPEKRAKYDRLGHDQFVSGRPAGYASAQEVDFGDLGSIIDSMFGGTRSRAGGGFSGGFGGGFNPQPRQPVRGQDIRISLKVSLRDVHEGGSKQISVPADGAYKSIDVKIPKAIKNGGKLRLREMGMASPMQGGHKGDVYVIIHIEKDAQFTRIDDGLDLNVDLPLSIAEATLGAKVEVPTIDGKVVMLTIPPSTDSETRFRIGGHGLNANAGKRGDMFAKVRIVPPSGAQISDALREALGEMIDQPPTEQSTDQSAEQSTDSSSA
ncbi:MAG: DnaJ domain-containing protein [Phycisphaerales bacterium]|nr:DnaJ domain-containing protein [Phycisphaerales bacterium]